ncbi:MAG: hypothetical protein JSU00_24330 [Acidobacteria bacterium]|nr:hypothetical protein [Acidobacteriota bacterium]
MDVNEVEAAVRGLISAMEKDRDNAIQRSPVYRRDFDNALGAVHTALDHIKKGRTDSLKNLWSKNVALRAVARNYDDEFARITSAMQ